MTQKPAMTHYYYIQLYKNIQKRPPNHKSSNIPPKQIYFSFIKPFKYKFPDCFLWFILIYLRIVVGMSEVEKIVEKKVTRMQLECIDLVIKTQYLKASKQKIKKDIQFYKSVINKLAFIYDLSAE